MDSYSGGQRDKQWWEWFEINWFQIVISNHFFDLWLWFEITFQLQICDFDLKSLFEWFWFWIDKLFANQSQTRIVASYRRRTAYIHNDKRRLLTCPDFCGKFYQWALGTLFSFVYSLLTDGDVMADKNVNDVSEVTITLR